MIALAIIALIVEIMLICSKEKARKVPINYILLGIFTFCEAFCVAYISAFYSAEACILAAGMTAGMTVGLTLYAVFTKTDFTAWHGLMFILCITALMLSFAGLLLGASRMGKAWIAGAFVIIYGLYLIYDTQLICDNHTYSLSLDDYVVGALLLYVDIVMLFIHLL